MLKVNASTKFKRDYKLCIKRGYDISLLHTAIDTLRIPTPLPPQNKDHILTGNYKGHRECHIAPNWLLIYLINDNELYLERTGTHSDLFKKKSMKKSNPIQPSGVKTTTVGSNHSGAVRGSSR